MFYDNLLIDIPGLLIGIAIIILAKKEGVKTIGWILAGWCGMGVVLHFLN